MQVQCAPCRDACAPLHAGVLQVVSMQLAQHVLQNQDKLIAGITNVTLVEDDLKVRTGRVADACTQTSKRQRQLSWKPCCRASVLHSPMLHMQRWS